MFINNINIKSFGAVLSDKQIQSAKININSIWIKKALDYIITSKNTQYKTIKLVINFMASEEQEVLNNISAFYALLQDKFTLKFDGIDFLYDCIYSQGDDLTKYTNDNYEATLTLLSGYAYKAPVTETLSHVNSKTINVGGNINTAPIVTITTPVDTISITLTGLGADPITIRSLKANMPVTLNGEDYTVLQNNINKFNEVDLLNFPVLKPGSNTITVDSANCAITIKYKPRYV